MSLCARHDGYYDKAGVWQRTKLCLVDCGDRCTCRPPNGKWVDPSKDTGWREGKTLEERIETAQTTVEELQKSRICSPDKLHEKFII